MYAPLRCGTYTLRVDRIRIGMNKRINILLPESTVRTIDRLAKPGERSRFINEAVQHFIVHRSTEALRRQLERAAVRDRDLDREVAADWIAVDQESWQNLEESKRKPTTRGEVRSTSRRSIRR